LPLPGSQHRQSSGLEISAEWLRSHEQQSFVATRSHNTWLNQPQQHTLSLLSVALQGPRADLRA
jgi:hypothetical protein